MAFLIKFLLLFALLGAALGYLLNGRTSDSAKQGAAGGIVLATIGLFQLLCFGALAIAGVWLITRIF
jgi:hypothetical protein